MRSSIGTLLALLVAAPALAGEGKWTPQQVLAQGPAWVKAQGFGLPLERLWDEEAGGGLLANAVQLPGCSGSFISAEGLLITNHHCADGILQEHSTPQANLSQDGYLARTRADEKKAGAFRIQVPRAFRDVTKEVLAAVPPGATDRQRFEAVEARQKALVAECESTPGTRCQFARVRRGPLLHADRVRGDQGRPAGLRPAPGRGQLRRRGRQLELAAPHRRLLAPAGLQGRPALPPAPLLPRLDRGRARGRRRGGARLPGPLVPLVDRRRDEGARGALVPGDPRPRRRVDRDPGRGGGALAGGGDRDDRRPARAREHAQERRGPDRGPAAGEDRGEAAGGGRARARVGREAAGRQARDRRRTRGWRRLNEQRLRTWDRDFLLDVASRGPRGLRWPLSLSRRATEGQKPDAQREPGYMERDLPRMRDQLERDQKRYDEAADRRLFRSWVKRALALPADQRIAAVDAAFAAAADDAAARRARRAALRGLAGLRPRGPQGHVRRDARRRSRPARTRCSTSASPSTRRGRP